MRQIKITPSITRRTNTLEKYFNEIVNEEPLSAEREVELVKRIKAGDNVAKEQLVKANLKFVVSVAKHYQHTAIPLGELISEGNIGLIKAAEKFDETRGFKFISYAVWWIRQAIMEALNKHSRFIRVPGNRIGQMSKLRQASDEWEQAYERTPTEEELADLLDKDEKSVKELITSFKSKMSLDAPVGTEDDAGSLIDLLENKEGNFVEEDFIHQGSLKAEISEALANLSEMESRIIKMVFGLEGSPALPLEDIGGRLSLSSERVRQIKNRAIKKLKDGPFRKQLKAYLGH